MSQKGDDIMICIISQLQGGLGNQMFQYAAGRVLALKHNAKLYLDAGPLATRGSHTAREYELGCFDIRASVLSTPAEWTHLQPVAFKTVQERGPRFMPELLRAPANSVLTGYWQSERYICNIRPTLRRDFTLRSPPDAVTQAWAERIRAPRPGRQSVMLHARRGDYVSNPSAAAHHGTCGLAYYQAALAQLQARLGNIEVYAFSDDPDWVQTHLAHLAPMHVVSHREQGGRPSHLELWLMQQCQHYVLANSSFSWWAAWLGETPQSLVICPAQWVQTPGFDTSDVTPSRWLRM